MAIEYAEERIELRQYLAVLRRQRLLVLAVTALSVGVALAYATLTSPTYEAHSEVLVQTVLPGASGPLPPPSMDTEREILMSEAVAIRSAEKLDWTGGIGDLLQRVQVDIPPDTQVLEVAFRAGDPPAASQGAEAFAESYLEFKSTQAGRSLSGQEVAARQLLENYLSRLENVTDSLKDTPAGSSERIALQAQKVELEAQVAALQTEISELENANLTAGEIIAHASRPKQPVSPNKPLDVGIGLFFGLFLGIVLAFVRDSTQGRLAGRSDTEDTLGAPVLSVVPRRARWRRAEGGLVTVTATRSAVAQSYRILGASLIRAHGRGGRTFLVTGASSPDGSPTVAANLAVVLAQAGHRVGVIAAPLDTGFARLFGSSSNGSTPADGRHPGLQRTRVRGVWLFRPPKKGLGEDLSHPVEARDLLDRILDVADFAVVHAGPLLTSAEAIALAPAVDGVVVVADGRRARRRTLRRMRATLQRVGGKLLGAVITGLPSSEAETYDEQAEGTLGEPAWPALPPRSETLA
jgi:capsular polysaccharide biosynthesis protein